MQIQLEALITLLDNGAKVDSADNQVNFILLCWSF